MNYCFDIDGTICTTGCDYNDSVPYVDVIDKINNLYDDGHHIEFLPQEELNPVKIGKVY